MDPFSTLPWITPIGWGGLVTLAVVSLIRGWLVPKLIQDRIESLYAERLADRDARIVELVAAYAIVDKRNDLLAGQVRELTEGIRTSNAVLAALPAVRGGVS
jgi:hypothetical protein